MWTRIFCKISLTLAVLAIGGLAIPPAQATLLLSGFDTNTVLEYDETTGEFIGTFASGGGLTNPTALLFAPNGNLLVSSWSTGAVLEYDGTTGEFIRTFASGGGLANTTGLLFAPNGNLLVGSLGTGAILEYDGTTGEFIKTFASGGELDSPIRFRFAPNGNLLVTNFLNGSVLEYDGTTGEFIKTFVPAGSGGLTFAEGINFAPNGNLLVSSLGSAFLSDRVGISAVLEYDGTTGQFIKTFASGSELTNPTGFVFTSNGNLLVSSFFNGSVLEYDGTTGEFIKTLVPAGSGGLTSATELIFSSKAIPVPEPSSEMGILVLSALGAIWTFKRHLK